MDMESLERLIAQLEPSEIEEILLLVESLQADAPEQKEEN